MTSPSSRHPAQPPRPLPPQAIPIHDDDDDDDDDDLWAESPGDSSYVTNGGSWRPMPPSMLASSLDINTSFRPRLAARLYATRTPTTAPSAPAPSAPTIPPPISATPRPTDEYLQPYSSTVQSYGATSQPVPPLPLPSRPTRIESVPNRRRTIRRSQSAPNRTVPIRAKLSNLATQLKYISEAPRELWLIFALKFFSSYAYFSLSLILTMYLTDEFGMSDTAAGWAYGAYGVMSTFFGLLCGWFIDYMGVRVSLLVGAVVGAFSRFVMAVTLSRHMAVLMLYTFLPFAECLGIPIMTIGIKRYTNANNRTFAFSLFYSMMNVAALCAGPLVDLSRHIFGEGFTIDTSAFGLIKFSGLRIVVLSSSAATALMSLVVLIGVREIHVDESGAVQEYVPNRESPISQTREVLRDPAFWRLTLFTLLLIGVRLVFRHMDATMPKYLVRQFGKDAPFGLIYAINPFLVIFLVPVVGFLTRKIASFPLILAGSVVSAASPFWVAMKQTYVGVVLFVVTLSLGEAVYSPRVYEYTMEVSANGSEGMYSSLSAAPLFSVKLLVGGMSGWLLTSFMPEHGPQNGSALWAIIGITSMSSPILMFLLREYISPSQPDLPPIPDEEGKAETIMTENMNTESIKIESVNTESINMDIIKMEDSASYGKIAPSHQNISRSRPPPGPSVAIRKNLSMNDIYASDRDIEIQLSSDQDIIPMSLPIGSSMTASLRTLSRPGP